MKWINAEQRVTLTIYDEEHEEYLDKTMTVEEALDAYTNEGCPTMLFVPEQKTGKWIKKSNTNPYWTEWWYECSECCHTPLHDRYRQEALTAYCPNCGARMVGEEE